MKFISSIYSGSMEKATKRIKYFPAALSSSQLFACLSFLFFLGPEELEKERNVFNKGWKILR